MVKYIFIYLQSFPGNISESRLFSPLLEVVLIILAAFFGFLILMKVLNTTFDWVRKNNPSRILLSFGLLILFGLFSVIYFLPRSQILIVDSWKTIGKVQESGFFTDKIFGSAPSRYEIDIRGRITALYLNDENLQSLEQLPGIEKLDSIEYLEISNSPLAGTLDVSAFTNLRELHLQNTNLRKIVGLKNLKNLFRLNVQGSTIEDLDLSETVEKIDLSHTKIANLSVLSRLYNLKELNLEGMDLSQISGFENLPSADLISLRNSSHIPLAQFNKVKILILDASDVTDLSPLANSRELMAISIFETKVEKLDGLENTKISLINSDNPNFTTEKAEQIFKRKVLVSSVNFRTFSIISPQTRQNIKIASIALIIVGFLLLLPLLFALQSPFLLKFRKIGLFMIPGAFLLIGLMAVSSIEIPMDYAREQQANFSRFAVLYAVCFAAYWFLLMPLLLFLLDTKSVKQSSISPAIYIFTRLTPILVFWGTPFVLIGYGFWNSENTAVGMVRIIAFFYFSISILNILILVAFTIAVWWKGKRKIVTAIWETLSTVWRIFPFLLSVIPLFIIGLVLFILTLIPGISAIL